MKRAFLYLWTGLLLASGTAGLFFQVSLPSSASSRNPGSSETIPWKWMRSSCETIRGSSTVVHGFNLRPERMTSIARELNARCVDALIVALSAHHSPDLPHPAGINAELWKNEFRDAFGELRSNGRGENLYHIGFSLGALVANVVFSENASPTPDAMLLFAPALYLRKSSHTVQALFPLPNETKIPSFSHPEYRVRPYTTVASNIALFDLVEEFKNVEKSKVASIPVDVIIDPKDELVSASRISAWIKDTHEHPAPLWKLTPIDASESTLSRSFRHLIIDSDATGRKEWEEKVLPIFDARFGKAVQETIQSKE